MSHDRLDVLERFEPLFDPPEPSFERFVRRRDRRRRTQQITAGVVGVAVFVAAIWIVTSGEPSGLDTTPGGTGPVTTSDEPAPVGLVGLAPEGATPSAPAKGELVLNFSFDHSGGDPGLFSVNVYEDGRVLRQRIGDMPGGVDYPDEPTGWVEQRLTPEGIELLRAEVLATGLFDHDLHFSAMPGLFSGWITVRNGGRTVEVTWGDVGVDGLETVAPTQGQADALRWLDVRLATLSAWLPATAWEDQEPKPFVPTWYSVCLDTVPGVGLDRVLGSLPRPAEEFLRPLDRTHEVSDRYGTFGTGFEIWCSTVTPGEARSLAGILDDGGVSSNGGDVFGIMYRTSDRAPVRVSISISPLLPHDA